MNEHEDTVADREDSTSSGDPSGAPDISSGDASISAEDARIGDLLMAWEPADLAWFDMETATARFREMLGRLSTDPAEQARIGRLYAAGFGLPGFICDGKCEDFCQWMDYAWAVPKGRVMHWLYHFCERHPVAYRVTVPLWAGRVKWRLSGASCWLRCWPAGVFRWRGGNPGHCAVWYYRTPWAAAWAARKLHKSI